MKTHALAGQKRTVTGKKVKSLRREGLIPATVYGKKVKSRSVSVSADAFAKIYSAAGETGLVELSIDKEVSPVLIHSVQVDPVYGKTLHIEFHQVDLKEKVHAKVPIELIGASPAVAQKLGVLLTVLNDIEVEALPADLPEKITLDVSTLAEVNQELKVGDVSLAKDVTVLSDASLTIVKVGSLVTKEAEAQAAAEAAQAAEAAAASAAATPATAEGQPAPAGEAPKSEATPAEAGATPTPKKSA